MATPRAFKSPSTGNAVTWDEAGIHTDTGVAYDAYGQTQAPTPPAGIINSNSWGGGQTQAEANTQAAAQTNVQAPPSAVPQSGKFNDAQRQTIYKAWMQKATPSPEDAATLAGSLNDNNVSIDDVQGLLQHGSDNGGYTQTAVSDYFRNHGYTADANGKLTKQSAAQAAPAAPAYSPVMMRDGKPENFTSPTTGNMVTWDSKGVHTDTGQKPVGTPSTAGTPTPNPSPSGNPVGTGGASGGLISSSMGPATSTVKNWEVAPNQTVKQQVSDLVSEDGVLMQKARADGLMMANERGLINTSMGVQAAQNAVLDKATEIGARDAGTYAQSAQFNANSGNQATMFNAGQANQWNTNDLDRGFKSGESALDRATNSSERAKDRAALLQKDGLETTTRKELLALENGYRVQLDKDSALDRQFSLYTDALFKIDMNPDLDAPAKIAMKADARANFQNFAKIRGLSLDLDFGGTPAPAPAATPAPPVPAPAVPPGNTGPSYGGGYA